MKDKKADNGNNSNQTGKKRDFSCEIDEKEREWRKKEIEGYMTVEEIRALGFHAVSFRTLLEDEEPDDDEEELSAENQAERENTEDNSSENQEFEDDCNIVEKCLNDEIEKVSISELLDGTIIRAINPCQYNSEDSELHSNLLANEELEYYKKKCTALLPITSHGTINGNNIALTARQAKICGIAGPAFVHCSHVFPIEKSIIIPGKDVIGTMFRPGTSDLLFKIMRKFFELKNKSELTFHVNNQPNTQDSLDGNIIAYLVMDFK